MYIHFNTPLLGGLSAALLTLGVGGFGVYPWNIRDSGYTVAYRTF